MTRYRTFAFENGFTLRVRVDSRFEDVFEELAEAMDKNGKIVDMWE